jgi:itaconate CoA-transferase
MLGLQNEREWAMFCDKVLEKPELKSDQRFSSATRRSDARKDLYRIIVDAFSGLTGSEVVARLDAAKIGNAAMNEMQQVWDHAQLAARNRWAEVDTPVGKIKAMMPPGMPESFEPRMDAVPGVGEHTDSILAELGYDHEHIARLHEAGVV